MDLVGSVFTRTGGGERIARGQGRRNRRELAPLGEGEGNRGREMGDFLYGDLSGPLPNKVEGRWEEGRERKRRGTKTTKKRAKVDARKERDKVARLRGETATTMPWDKTVVLGVSAGYLVGGRSWGGVLRCLRQAPPSSDNVRWGRRGGSAEAASARQVWDASKRSKEGVRGQ